MTMTACVVDAALYEKERESRLSARRFNKHMAERKRRARINTALEELKSMIIKNMHKDPEEFEKMEKADILDLTVKFLRAAQQQKKQLSARASPTADTSASTMTQQQKTAAAYASGYNVSANQVQRFVSSSDMDADMAARLAAHLNSRRMSSLPVARAHVVQRPVVRRCEPSPRLCRDLTREINNNHLPYSQIAPANMAAAAAAGSSSSSAATGNADLCRSFRSLAPTKPHPAVSAGVWRPWVVA